ncbi:MAG: cyclic nucleotide-binding domain-containing protein [Acidimicrobiia bacterium]|nr:cyclic nucleotide-binding domain-containing protein [Acidimicrobiia bacterium]
MRRRPESGTIVPMEILGTLGLADRVVAVQQVSIFSELPVTDIQRIAEAAGECRYSAGDVVFRVGDAEHHLIVIVAGGVTLTSGQNEMVDTRSVGDYLGELALLRHLPRSVTATAGQEGMHGLTITCQALESIIEERPQIASVMVRSLADKLASLETGEDR